MKHHNPIFIEAVTEAIVEASLVLLEQAAIAITGLMRLCMGDRQPQEPEELDSMGLDAKNLFLLVQRGGDDEES